MDDRTRRKSRKRPTDWATKTWKENEVLTDYFFLQLHGASFKKRAPKAIKEIKDFAQKAMVRIPEFRACTFSTNTQSPLFIYSPTDLHQRAAARRKGNS